MPERRHPVTLPSVLSKLTKAIEHLTRELCEHRIERDVLGRIEQKLEKIMATQTEAAIQVNALTAKINKIGSETANTLQKVKDLEAIIVAGGEVTPELQAALDAAVAAAQVADDLIPDAQVPPPAP